MLRRLTFAIVFLCLMSMQQVAHAAAAAPDVMSADEMTALQSLAAKADSSGRGFVDLTDDDSKKAYFALLRTHGFTQTTRPQLFESLQEIERAQLDRKKLGLAPVIYGECSPPTQNADDRPMTHGEDQPIGKYRGIVNVVASPDFQTVQAVALDTTPGSVVYSLGLVDLYSGVFQKHIGTGANEAFAPAPGDTKEERANPRFQLFATEKQPNNNPGGGPITAFASYIYRSVRNTHTYTHPPCFVVQASPIHQIPKDMTLDDPTNRKSPPGTPVVICWARHAGEAGAPCDYGPMSPNETTARMRLIVKGAIAFNDNVARIVNEDGTPTDNLTGEMTIIPTQTGGVCPIVPIEGKTLVDHFVVDKDDPKTLRFAWPTVTNSADFGELCWGAVPNNTNWDFLLSLKVTTVGKNGDKHNVLAVFLSRAPAGLVNIARVPQLAPQYGCIRAGALVTMADGRRIPIEAVKKGDLVASPIGPLRVHDVTQGKDVEFIKISRADGPPLFVTKTHPIAIATAPAAHETAGAVRAAVADPTFIEAETLLQRKASSRGTPLNVLWKPQDGAMANVPVAVERLSKSDTVYNLTLENADGSPLAHAETAMFYANGIVVGDNRVQGKLEAEKRMADAKAAVYRPSGIELVDYKNWLAQRAATHAAEPKSATY